VPPTLNRLKRIDVVFTISSSGSGSRSLSRGFHSVRRSRGMLRRRRWAPVARHIVEDGSHLVQHAVALGQVAPLLERYPCALVLSIAALHLLVHALLHFALEDAGPGGLIVVGYLEDMGSVDPVVGAPSHNMVAVDIAFVDRDLRCVSSLSQTARCVQPAQADGDSGRGCAVLTLLYVAE
jgi:hypothetical protein